MKNFTLSIRRKRWRIHFVNSADIRGSWGECDDPSARSPKIRIWKNASRRDLINTLLHEVLHAVRPELSEEAVDETANILERALNRVGYEIKE